MDQIHALVRSGEPHRSTVLIAPMLFLIGCVPDWVKDDYEPIKGDSGDTGDFNCSFGADVVGNSSAPYDNIVAYCVKYDGPDFGEPYKVTGSWTTCDSTAATYWPVEIDTDTFVVEASQQYGVNGASQDLCIEASTLAFHYTTTSCGDYSKIGYNAVLKDEWGLYYNRFTSDGAVGCPYANEQVSLAPREATMLKWSAPGCSPGSATFNLVPRAMRGENLSGLAVQLVPVAESDAVFPERAWLRGVEVEDWGDVPMLRFASYGQELTFSGGSVTGGYVLEAPDTELGFSSGEVMMSAMIGGASISEGAELPRLTLTWSCEVASPPTPPHYAAVPGNAPHLMDLSEYGVDHRFVLWVDETHQMVRVAPRGRFQDYVQFPYSDTGHFIGRFPMLRASWEGWISFDEDDVVIENLTLNAPGLDDPIEIAEVSLAPL